MEYKASYYFGGPPEQAVVSMCRKMGGKKELDYNRFVAALVDPSVLDGEGR